MQILLILLLILLPITLALYIKNDIFAYQVKEENNDYVYNVLKDELDTRDYIFNIPIPKDFKLNSIDWSVFTNDVLDQGKVNGCTSNSVSKAIQINENMYNWKTGKSESNPLRSRMYIYYKSRQLFPGRIPITDYGTSLRSTMKVIVKNLPYEYDWPYDEQHLNKQPPNTLITSSIVDNQVISYFRVPLTIEDMKSALIKNVIVVRIDCPEKLPNKNGILKPIDVNNIKGGHAVVIVGFDDTKSVFKFLNSWGTKWGDKGYGYLPYEYIQDYITDMWTFVIDDKSHTSWGMMYGKCNEITNRNTWLEHADVVKNSGSRECWYRYCENSDKTKCGGLNIPSIYKGCYINNTLSISKSTDENNCW